MVAPLGVVEAAVVVVEAPLVALEVGAVVAVPLEKAILIPQEGFLWEGLAEALLVPEDIVGEAFLVVVDLMVAGLVVVDPVETVPVF